MTDPEPLGPGELKPFQLLTELGSHDCDVSTCSYCDDRHMKLRLCATINAQAEVMRKLVEEINCAAYDDRCSKSDFKELDEAVAEAKKLLGQS